MPGKLKGKLSLKKQRDLELMHLQFVDSLCAGSVDIQEVDNWLSVARLWYIIAVQQGKHTKLLQEQVALAQRMCLEAGSGQLQLTDAELDSIKRSVAAMAWLAHRVTQHDASMAVEIAEVQTNTFLEGVEHSGIHDQ